jgi:hypothetical protein
VFGVLGALLLLGGGAVATHAYTNSQQDIPNTSAYYPVMWRDASADVLFPKFLGDRVGYGEVHANADHAQWNRLGISQDTSCTKGLNGTTRDAVVKQGCKAVLRATYGDPTGDTVTTIALIVLSDKNPDPRDLFAYFNDQRSEKHPDGAVHPFAVPGTPAARWSDATRSGVAGGEAGATTAPYVLAVVAGAADGRRARTLPGEHDTTDLGPWMDAANGFLQTYGLYFADPDKEKSK